MMWTPEPTYDKPDISVRATTLYYQIAAPIMLPFLSGRLLNLFRCREGKCFFQRNREHPPTGNEFDTLVGLQPVKQKNGRTEEYLYVASVGGGKKKKRPARRIFFLRGVWTRSLPAPGSRQSSSTAGAAAQARSRLP